MAGAESFRTSAASRPRRARWSAQPVLARIAAILTVVSALSFFPLYFWKSKILLMIAAGLTWITMTYVGAMSLFGSRAMVDAITWQGQQNYSELVRQIFGRVFGAILLTFMIFAAYEIFQGGFTAAYNNFGR
jgi:amino acid permease